MLPFSLDIGAWGPVSLELDNVSGKGGARVAGSQVKDPRSTKRGSLQNQGDWVFDERKDYFQIQTWGCGHYRRAHQRPRSIRSLSNVSLTNE